MARLGNVFSCGRIYDGKQRVMKPREIFTVSVRAYYPGEENGVNWKYLLKTGCCLLSERKGGKNTVFPLCHRRSHISNSEVSVEASDIDGAESKWAIHCKRLMSGLLHRSVLHMVHCLITLLWSITFTVQLMWRLPLFKVYTRPPCEHGDDLYSPRQKQGLCLMHIPLVSGLKFNDRTFIRMQSCHGSGGALIWPRTWSYSACVMHGICQRPKLRNRFLWNVHVLEWQDMDRKRDPFISGADLDKGADSGIVILLSAISLSIYFQLLDLQMDISMLQSDCDPAPL